MSSWLGKFHDFTGKYDPLGHALVNGAWKTSTKLVNESSRGMVKAGDKLGINTSIPAYGRDTSQKDKGSFNRWGENSLGSAAAVVGAGYGAGYLGGGEGAGAAGAGAGGAEAGLGAGGATGAGTGAAYTEAGGAVVSPTAGNGLAWTAGDAGTAGATGAQGTGAASNPWYQKLAQMGMKQMAGGGGGSGGGGGGGNTPLAQQLSDRMKMQDEQSTDQPTGTDPNFTNQSAPPTMQLTPEQQRQFALLLQQRMADGQGYA
jgi:hypothetical protein